MSDTQAAQRELAEKIKQIRMTPGADNKPVLAVNIERLQNAKNGGYPKPLYHDAMEPVFAMSDKEETVYLAHGYYPTYRHRQYPRAKYRRNMDPKFALSQAEIAEQQKIGGYLREPFIEAIEVKTPEDELALKKKARPATAGPWVDSVGELEPLPEASAEDPAVTIARLQGELDEARRQKTSSAKG